MKKLRAQKVFDGTKFLSPTPSIIVRTDGTIHDLYYGDAHHNDDTIYYDGILCPAFINAHCHLELSALTGRIPKHTGLTDFLQAVVRARAQCTQREIQQAAYSAARAMYESGISAVGDICNTTDALAVKINFPKITFHNFIEVFGFTEQVNEARWAQDLAVHAAYKKNFVRTTMAAHAPYSVSPALFSRIATHSAGDITSIHNQECEAENELYKSLSGALPLMLEQMKIPCGYFRATQKSSLQSVAAHFRQNTRLLLVHNNAVSYDDICYIQKILPQVRIAFVLCPHAGAYIQNIAPPISLLRRMGVLIALGTDSLASNDELCLWREAKLLASYEHIPLAELLGYLTASGAIALGMENELGYLRVGARGGVVHIGGLREGEITQESYAERVA